MNTVMDRREREQILKRLQADAERIAGHFKLEYRAIRAEHPRVRARYGVCYDDGLIKIRLNHAKTGEPLRYSSLVDTLCHELAHLRHFNHGPKFKAFFWQLLGWAREQRIYCPRPRRRGGQQSGRQDRFAPVARGPRRRNGVPIFIKPGTDPSPERPRGLGQRSAQLALAIAEVAPSSRPVRGKERPV